MRNRIFDKLCQRSDLLRVCSERRMFIILLLGFSSGLPLALTGATLQAWMTDEKLPLTIIAYFSAVGLPYSLKFLWAPVMDRFVPPHFGRRRGWMLACQCALFVSIWSFSLLSPAGQPLLVAAVAFCISFFSASQDIVIDAYRAEALNHDELGAGAGIAILGYRLGMLVSGALALILADHLPWSLVYRLMAGCLLVGIAAALLADEPQSGNSAPKKLLDAVILPFIDFFKRSSVRSACEILLFLVLYKLGDVMAVTLTTNFMITLGFTKTEIGAVTKMLGLAATIIGSLAGGVITDKLGLKRALVVLGLAQACAPLCYAALSFSGKNSAVMALAVGAENFCAGLGTAPFIALLMSLCNKRFTATQYALLSSIPALSRVWGGVPTGRIVELIGWTPFFCLCSVLSLPGILLVGARFDRWTKNSNSSVPA